MSFIDVDSVVKWYSKHYIEKKPERVVTTDKGHREAIYPNGLRVHFKFAKKPFLKFGTVYSDVKYGGCGASINKEKLEQAIENGCDFFVTGYQEPPENTGYMYRYPIQNFKEWAEEHGTTRVTQYQPEKETTYSMPLAQMEQIKPLVTA